MRVAAKSADTKVSPEAQEREASPTSTETPAETVPAEATARPEWGPSGFDANKAAKAEAVSSTTTAKSPRELVDDFYNAFARKDGKAMAAAYADGAHFRDPVFPSLDGAQAGAMWRMLTRSEDLTVRHEILSESGDTVTAKWIANYSAPGTGRPVENHITATIRIKDGKIVDHVDAFDMNKWVAQAFGGWSKLPFATSALAALTRHLAGRQLDSFIEKGR